MLCISAVNEIVFIIIIIIIIIILLREMNILGGSPLFLDGISYLLPCTTIPFWKGVYSVRKDFAPSE